MPKASDGLIIIDSILYTLNLIINDYSQNPVQITFFESFLSKSQERVEFIYKQFHCIENLEYKDPKVQSIYTS